MLYSETLHVGQAWSMPVKRGMAITLEALGAEPNVAALFYNARQPQDRYNMPDTLKGQHISRLTTGSCLHSDMGRLLASIVEDNIGWHDPICGLTNAKSIEAKYGSKTFKEARNNFYRNGFDTMVVELMKQGMSKKDLVPNINFFSKVFADEDGRLNYVPNHGAQGSRVTLRTEMDVIVVLSNTPHPLHNGESYPGCKVRIDIDVAPKPASDDVCYGSRPENQWAHDTTEAYLAISSEVS